MKKNIQTTPAAPDFARAKSLLAELKSTVRLSLALQILLGKELAICKKQLEFVRGRHIVIRQLGGSEKSWDQYCREELEIASRTSDRYIQCFEAAKARATNLRAKAGREKAKALEKGETKEAAKWEKVIKKCDKAIRLLRTPAADLAGGDENELTAYVGFLIQRQDRDKFPTAAANITQAELLEELGIKAPPRALQGGGSIGNGGDAGSGEDAQAIFNQMVIDLYSGIARGCGDLENMICRGRNRSEFHEMLKVIPLATEVKNAPCLYAIRDSLRGVFDGELPKMILAVEQTIKEKEEEMEKKNSGMSAKPARRKHIKA